MNENNTYTAQQGMLRMMQTMLQPGEILAWHGAPVKGLRWKRKDWFELPFGLFFLGFSIFWTVGAFAGGGLFGLFGVPFMCVGLYLAVGKFFHDAYKRNHTYYGITNQRIILIEPKSVKSIPYGQISCLELETEKGDVGTVYLAPQMYERRNGRTYSAGERTGLRLIPNAYQIYSIIQSQMMHQK